jgi:beta-glucosidase
MKEIYKEDILVGYRWFDTKHIVPRFPFGHGLSYTTFKYGKAKIDKADMSGNDSITIRVPVKNIGKIPGKEVVQLYIKDCKSSVLRPEKELKGFSKVSLLPGEEKIVTLKIDRNKLCYYDEAKKAFVAEPGQFVALIGSSSRDIRAIVKFGYKSGE